MIKKLLATTAVATLLAGGVIAVAQEQPAPAPAPTTAAPADPAAPAEVIKADGFLASNIIGETVYNGTGENAENIGDVNDIVIDMDGKVASVIIGVGGFLGMGEKNVALDFSEIEWAEQDGDRWIVVAATKEQLEGLPDFDRAPYDPAPAPVAATEQPMTGTDTTAEAPAEPAPMEETAEAPAADAPAATEEETAEAPAADAPAATEEETAAAPAEEPAETETTAKADKPMTEETAEAPAAEEPAATEETAEAPAADGAVDETATAAIDKSTLQEIPSGELRAEDLVGTTVYGADDANVGEIGDVILTTDGKIDAVIIDVGGFLGVGEKEVAVGMDNLVFMTDGNGNEYLYTNFTKEQLDAAAAYDESSWAENRDDQRLIMTE